LKKPFSPCLVVVLLILTFTIGVFVGRATAYGNVSVTVEREYAGSTNNEDPANFKLNINTATADQLQQIPGLGPALAQRIVDYRDEYGPFASTDDLLNISGIGNAKLSTIIPYLTVGG